MSTYERFERLREILGDEELLENVYRYFGDWEMQDCIESIETDFEIVGEEDE